MQQTINPIVKERQRKFLLVLPVLVFPFITFLLWSVGVFSADGKTTSKNVAQQGFNMHLPDARLKDNKSWNKLDFYQQADADSAKMKEAMENDPFFKEGLKSLQSDTDNPYHFSYDHSPSGTLGDYHDPNVDKVNQQLAKLNAALNQPPQPVPSIKDTSAVTHTAIDNDAVDRLQNVVQAIHQTDTTADPEMQQLNAMMDKVLDIQHPERVQAAMQEQFVKYKGKVFPVTAKDNNDNITVLQTKQIQDSSLPVRQTNNAFYSLDDNTINNVVQSSMQAVVQETQTLVSGSTVKLRLLDDVYINGVLIPKNCFVYGTASLNGERLNISINTIRHENNILPVSLSVYDLDGMSGIFIPGAITRDVAKQSANEATQSIGLATLDPSIGAQVASAGIQAAKSLIGKKIKLVKVIVKAGYQVLLKDNNNKQ